MTDRATAMVAFARELFPICRSIAGPGLRETIDRIGRRIPLSVSEVPTGTPVLDWEVPREWSLRGAWIRAADGSTVLDAAHSNLHVVNYSVPVRRTLTMDELRPHLHTVPDHPEWIPYRTSYHREQWGFCLSQRQLDGLGAGPFEVCIDTELRPGALTYGEWVLPGATAREVMLTAHCCHPSLANDNVSGMVLATFLADALSQRPSRRLTYRIVFAPGTIGAITWLARNRDRVNLISAGLVIACVGDQGQFRYKRTKAGTASLDRAVEAVLHRRGRPFLTVPFSPLGYDERQYSSPGFDLPFGSLTRTSHGQYPEYHTSADNLDLISGPALEESLSVYLEVLDLLEADRRYRNLAPFGEPQLGRRGLFRGEGGKVAPGELEGALLWLLNCSDGRHGLLDIAARSSISVATLVEAASRLVAVGLLEPEPDSR